jgi:uncharacterized YccA/Bax inhibitor family protein
MRLGKNLLQTSNPALKDPNAWREGLAEGGAGVASIQGAVNKTAMLTAVALAGGMGGIALMQQPNFSQYAWLLGIGAFITTIVLYFMILRKPMRAKGMAWIYAAIQGAFLGVITNALDSTLASMEIAVPGGLAIQAFAITMSVLIAMLTLYYFRILRPTKMFVNVVSVLTLGIFITYMISFAMSMFGTEMPFLNIGSALQGGTAGWIGLGINVLILGVASLWLIIDFGMIEKQIQSGAPKQMEWFCGFILMVTLVWIYLEALKLCFRLSILLSGRD